MDSTVNILLCLLYVLLISFLLLDWDILMIMNVSLFHQYLEYQAHNW